MARKAQFDHVALADTLRRQHNVIGLAEALGCGMSHGALRHRLRPGGPWQILLPGSYLVYAGLPTVAQREMAALLYAGPGSAITGIAAARRHGIRAPHTEMIDVLVPSPRKPQSIRLVTVHRTMRMPERVWADGAISYVPAARAVADIARSLTDLSEVRAVVADGV